MDNKELFLEDSKEMWRIGLEGTKVRLIPDLNEVLKHKFRKFFKSRNVTYFYEKKDKELNLYIEESDGKMDWIQNLMAFNYKVVIGGTSRKYHLGFYLTAITIFKYLKRNAMLTEDVIVNSYGYSHGAGALPILASLIRNNSEATVATVVGFEQPRYIKKPNLDVQEECAKDIRYKQGNDIVTEVPWWMTHVGILRCIPSQKYKTLKKKLLHRLYDHDIYWSNKLKEIKNG